MKKMLFILLVAGLFFSCSKKDGPGQSLKEIVGIEKVKVAQDSVNALLVGEWEEISDNETRYRITVSDSRFLLQELNPLYPKPATSIETSNYFYAHDERFPHVYQMVDLTEMEHEIAIAVLFEYAGDQLYLFPMTPYYYHEGFRPDNFRDLNESNALILTRIK